MAADQQLDGYLYAVWADYGTGDADILLSRSTNNGADLGLEFWYVASSRPGATALTASPGTGTLYATDI